MQFIESETVTLNGIIGEEHRSCDGGEGRGGRAQRHFWNVNEPKNTGLRSACQHNATRTQ
jgi:hypothetical protein